MSYLLTDFSLIQDEKLRAVSSFHHFVKDFKGERIAGGIYLSLKKMKSLSEIPYVLFADESQELEDRLSFFKKEIPSIKHIHLIKSRNKTPFQVTEELVNLLQPYLDYKCGYKIQNLKKDLKRILKLSQEMKFPEDKSFLFYLGDQSFGNQNQTLLVNDSFNLVFKLNEKFRTYPSDLAYVSPSVKILRSMEGSSINLGLVENNRKELKVEEVKKNTYNLYQEGILYPGLSQVYFIENFSKWVSKL